MNTKIKIQGRLMTVLKVVPVVGILLFAFTNCSGKYDSNGAATNLSNSINVPQVKLSLKILDSSGATVCDGCNSQNSLFNVQTSENYTFVVSSDSQPSGLAVSLTGINMTPGSPAAASQGFNQPLVVGNNAISNGVFAPGSYKLSLNATAPNMMALAQPYTANAVCNVAAGGVSIAGISVGVTVSGNNKYSFAVSGMPAFDGSTPARATLCELDPTGTGIFDTPIESCGSSHTFSNLFSYFYNTRKVAVGILDACNNPSVAFASVNIMDSPPAMGVGNVFISGQTGAVSGPLAGDPRVDTASVLATNNNGNVIQQPMYTLSAGKFTIGASHQYSTGSSIPYGFALQMTGIVETTPVDLVTGAGALDVSHASISATFSTDQIGDAKPGMSAHSVSCTYTPGGAKVKFVGGIPCGTLPIPPNPSSPDQYTVEVWGSYNCNMTDGNGNTFNFSGEFDGFDDMKDSCTGGGQGGGGVPPTTA